MKAPQRFAAAAAALGIDVVVRRYPEGTRTAADAAAAIGCDVGQIVKSLVFVVDGSVVLALTSGAHRVDPSALAAAFGGSEARPATADEARAATGFAIGGTPPFGHPAPVPTVVDPHLGVYDVVWAAAGAPDAVFPIAPADLVRVAAAREASFTT
ncbi:MAG TPA: YbaK/EbsC family protein [Acidimicrobiia bacterium]|nr:YbaK/EbsC family protein [Acidimicrobiia bacterium]